MAGMSPRYDPGTALRTGRLSKPIGCSKLNWTFQTHFGAM